MLAQMGRVSQFGDGVTGNVVPVTPAGVGGEVGSERGRSLAFAVRTGDANAGPENEGAFGVR